MKGVDAAHIRSRMHTGRCEYPAYTDQFNAVAGRLVRVNVHADYVDQWPAAVQQRALQVHQAQQVHAQQPPAPPPQPPPPAVPPPPGLQPPAAAPAAAPNDARMDNIDARLAAIEAANNMAPDFGAITARLDALEQLVQSMAQVDQMHGDQINTINTNLAQVETSVTDQDTNVAGVEVRIGQLEVQLTTAPFRIGGQRPGGPGNATVSATAPAAQPSPGEGA